MSVEIAVVGAGPYGLAAAEVLSRQGLSVRAFGLPMEAWSRYMPRGMLLRSAWEACHIGRPRGPLSLAAYEREAGGLGEGPVPLEHFVAYGRWFEERSGHDTDRRSVSGITRDGDGFRLALDDGEQLEAGGVVVAAGILPFARRPAPFDALPPELVSHTFDHDDLSGFARRRVLVVGAGQSALESAALLAEAGAEPEIVARREALRWLHGAGLRRRLGPLRPLVYASTDVGPPGLNHLIARPRLLMSLPPTGLARITDRSVRPAGADWLRSRLASVPVTLASPVQRAEARNGTVDVTLGDGSRREVDHVLLGTGYAVDIERYSFLGPDLLDDLERRDGYPVLDASFQSSVPRLRFVGAAAALSHGPLMRFVSGTWHTSRSLRRALAGRGA